MHLIAVLLLALLTILPVTAPAATLLVSPVPSGDVVTSVDLSFNRMRYELPDDRFYVNRTIVSFSWAYESFFASLGYIADGSFDEYDLEAAAGPEDPAFDPGYVLAVGARGVAWRSGDLAVNLHTQFHVLNEKLVSHDVRYKMQSFEVLAGFTAAWVQPGWRAYAGVEALPYSDVSADAPGFGRTKRSDFITLHAGGGANVGPICLDADVQFMGAEGVRLGVGYAF